MQLPSRLGHRVIDPLPSGDLPVPVYNPMRPGDFSMFLYGPAKTKMHQVITDDMLGILVRPHIFAQILHRLFSLSIMTGARLRHHDGANRHSKY